MPTYSYRCTECAHAFDVQQSFTDSSLTVCPNCGGVLRKVFSPIGVTFSGSGFYRTDSRAAAERAKGGSKDAAAAASGSSSDSGSGSGSDSGSGSGSGSSSDSGSGSSAPTKTEKSGAATKGKPKSSPSTTGASKKTSGSSGSA